MADQPQNSNPLDSKNNVVNKLGSSYPGKNPREAEIPDAATLREQWRFAIRQYSKWYSHAWGTAILAGVSIFALGWLIKGSNPLPSKKEAPAHHHHTSPPPTNQDQS
ncbi:hypothetical protein IFM89_007874 [Coptis chinensis]|uniref:Uncharacterized protein n=1 Tax=Coptis chinensis TaxID=261450 RepID=A0A835GV80_9MAGN|nr:hypothetical protein IFM89_007874 [Coptis chinensis]